MKVFAFVAISVLWFASQSPAADKKKWTVDDVINSESASGFGLSPDARWVVWAKSVMDKEKGERITNLMRTDLKEGEEIELTRGADSCDSPQWSPDGKLIAFLSARPSPKTADKRPAPQRSRLSKTDSQQTQIWIINAFGGEAWRLTDIARDVRGYEWAGADRLIFMAKEEKTLHEITVDDDKKDTSTVVDDEKYEPPVRLFQVDLKSKKVKRLTENTDRIDMLAVSPNGKWAVTRHQRSLRYEYDSKIKPVIYLTDLSTGVGKQIFDDKHFNISAARWTPDSKGFYATNEFSGNSQYSYPSVSQAYHFDLEAGREKLVDLGWENGLIVQDANGSEPGLLVVKEGFIALLADGARNKLARFTRDGDKWKRERIEGDHTSNIFGVVVAKDEKSLIYNYSTASKPAEWQHAPLEGNRVGKAKAFTTLNEKFNDYPIAKSEVIRWKGARDEEVEGILYYPHDYEKGKRYPLIVMIHGGPNWADQDDWQESWAYAANLYCQRNAFVFKPNYHGSNNYGLKWAQSIANGNYYDLEIPDIEKGVDNLIDKGFVDKDKLGVLGWSNGSILTIELTTRTTRYKAAAAGAGDVDWASDWANCDFGDTFDRAYLGKGPLEDPQLYFRKSPFYRLDKVRTPTIIFFGTEDRQVAAQQGWMHYRALQQLDKTEVRFVLFPGERHSPKKFVHEHRKLQEELDWFDKHLFKTAKTANEALKDDSPLAHSLKLQAASRCAGPLIGNDVYGVSLKDEVVPEVVDHSGLKVGRFEVTRAQYRCFDSKRQVAKGTDDFPVVELAFEDAQRYCEWLSKLTGDKYRLPTEKEGEDLYAGSEANENTLDYWAGYAVNPDDAQRLSETIKSLGKTTLLKPVGQFRAAGEAGVFDLGGNVAEWVTTKEGKGKLMGGSADQPTDPKTPAGKAAPEYRGFRVVRDEKK